MHNRLRAAKAEEGFSLVELLIVIVVLGVLSGIVVFGVGTFKEDAVAACKGADAKSLEVAQKAYEAKTGTANADAATLKTAKYLNSTSTC